MKTWLIQLLIVEQVLLDLYQMHEKHINVTYRNVSVAEAFHLMLAMN